MQRSSRRLAVLGLGLVALVLVTAVIYRSGMARLEGRPRTFVQALEWTSETLTTTGYGADNRWEHPAMAVFVAVVQFVGTFLPPLLVALILVPFLAARFEQRVPRQPSESLTGHVVVFRFGPAVEALLQRLQSRGVPSLVVELDEAQARAVMESGQAVVFSRAEEDVLDACRLEHARAIVANGRDQENAALILRARQMGFRGEVYAFVEEPAHRKPMELAGATAAYTPRHIVAAALAAHASDRLNPRLPGIDQLAGLERSEIRVASSCPLAGKTLLAARLPVAVVGIWSRSRLNAHCSADTVIEPNSVLEVVGDQEAVGEAARMLGTRALRTSGPFLIGGFGEVGRKVRELLTDVGEEVRVIERHPGPNVDVVGDVLDSSVLAAAGLAEARALVLALDSDDSTLFATVIARDLADDVPVIARVNHGRNLENIHRAGADYALSISDVSGEMLSARLLGRGARVHEEHRRIQRLAGAAFAGRTPAELALAEGRAILAVERGGELIHRIDPELRIDEGDSVWVCGV